MPRAGKPALFRPPYLRSAVLNLDEVEDADAYPFSIPAIAAEPFTLTFTRPVTVLAGPNGSGKSTILEALAACCGFGRQGGNRNHALGDQAVNRGENRLAEHLRLSWLPKVTQGFFVRGESFPGFIRQLDGLDSGWVDEGDALQGRPLSERSHGEAYHKVFRTRLRGHGIFLLDEPEVALSPNRQLELLRGIRAAEGDAQFIIATHSPLLMAYPGATLLHLTGAGIVERPFTVTEHFRTLREFYLDPASFMAGVFAD